MKPALRPVQTASVLVRAALIPEEMERAERLLNAQWPKRCGCGRSYYRVAVGALDLHWDGLLRRYQSTDEAGVLEARDCLCGSTISVYLAILDPDVAAEDA